MELLCTLWLDSLVIEGDALGEGDPGDLDYGAWHIACHLVAAGGICRAADGRLVFLELSHVPSSDTYLATVTVNSNGHPETWPITSAEGRRLLHNAEVLGFVEGNSLGRTSVRTAHDPPTLFNLWRRQDFDQPVDSQLDGGKVWEHWCTTRDIRPGSRLGSSVLTAYICLCSALGDRFAALVGRGRRDYSHPKQLCALVHAGFVSEASALADTQPLTIPKGAEELLLQAEPSRSLQAVESLDWSTTPSYYMFERRIDRWCSPGEIREAMQQFDVR